METEAEKLSRRDAARWFALAVGSVAVAGLFALYLAVARIPGLETTLSPDPHFGHRGLIVHVNLALGVWFSACLAALFCLLPGARRTRLTPLAQLLALGGVLAFTATVFVREAEPLKSNYVPSLDHPLFVFGTSLFACAVAASLLDRRLIARGTASDLPADAHFGMRVAAVIYLLSIGTFVGAYATQADGLEPLPYYERLYWGGGHVQQFANVAAMAAAWLFLLSRVFKGPILEPRTAVVLFALILLPALAGPVLTATSQPPQHFTFMMRWGIWPGLSLLLVAVLVSVWQRRKLLTRGLVRGTAFIGFAVSASMTVAGFIVGAMIRDNDTLVPAHYHMSLSAVTVAFMAALLELLPTLGAPLHSAGARRWAALQPLLYGAGMAVMAVGFGLAKSERKTYGTEQVVRSAGEWAGLVTMGIGGIIASVGGIVFLVLLVSAVRQRRLTTQTPGPKTTR
jgi:cytochrome c oxidase subunit 1